MFWDLLGRATAVLELDGRRSDEGSAYFNAGRAMIEQVDVLLAVWDGEASRGRGGTAEIVAAAALHGIPVYVIAPESPARIRRFRSAAEWRIDLGVEMRRLCVLPEDEAMRWRRFCEEPVRRLNWGWWFQSFRNLLTRGRPGGGSFRLPQPDVAVRPEWETSWRKHSRMPVRLEAAINDGLLGTYARADHLANYYAGLFRSAYLVRYVLGGIMACLVAVGFYTKAYQWQGFVAQMIVLLILLALVRADQRNQWHLRSMEYRILAENLRLLHFNWPLGAGFGRQARVTNRLREAPRWVVHALRIPLREMGLPNAVITSEFLHQHCDFLAGAELDGQIAYHAATAEWQVTLGERLKHLSMAFFVAGVVALGVRAGFYTIDNPAATASIGSGTWNAACYAAYWSKVLSIVLPAAGALFAGIRSHGEFARLGARSKAMAAHLSHMRTQLSEFPSERWEEAVCIAEDLANEMTGEVADWRTLTGGKALSVPV